MKNAWTAVLLALATLAVTPAHSQMFNMGPGGLNGPIIVMVCETRPQIERYIQLLGLQGTANPDVAQQTVNRENGREVCGVHGLLYTQQRIVKTGIQSGGHEYAVFEWFVHDYQRYDALESKLIMDFRYSAGRKN